MARPSIFLLIFDNYIDIWNESIYKRIKVLIKFISKLPFTFYFYSLIQFFLTSEQKSHFVHGKRPLLKPPPPLTAIGPFAWRRWEWTLSLSFIFCLQIGWGSGQPLDQSQRNSGKDLSLREDSQIDFFMQSILWTLGVRGFALGKTHKSILSFIMSFWCFPETLHSPSCETSGWDLCNKIKIKT